MVGSSSSSGSVSVFPITVVLVFVVEGGAVVVAAAALVEVDPPIHPLATSIQPHVLRVNLDNGFETTLDGS
jgi:hypothetical protein